MNITWKRIAALFRLSLLYFSPVKAQTWDSLLATIRKRFPGVRQMPACEFAIWLADTNRSRGLLLVDVRRPEEFAVSQLRGATNLTSVTAVKAVAATDARPIVVYCSVGYRSSALAEKLQKAGLTNVFNLEGSIFAWANEGRAVYRGHFKLNPVQVHPYDEKWGKLLKPQFHPAVK
jgi:rhodanese-related sulfurtransferase